MNDSANIPLTTRTRVALAIGRGVAAARGDHDLTPTHVAIGLLREAENPAVSALHLGGVDLALIRSELELELGPPGHPRPGEVAISLTPGEQRIVVQASLESGGRGDEFIGPHHLLLALLRDTSSATAQVFARHGFLFDTAVTQLERVVHLHTEPPLA